MLEFERIIINDKSRFQLGPQDNHGHVIALLGQCGDPAFIIEQMSL